MTFINFKKLATTGEDYNYNHPHKSLGTKFPTEYMPRFDEELQKMIWSKETE
ncbi:hypothetical protein [Nonlabens sp.]|uniref:hypothetical protein n=1 Tax=Nonlabens sp. TaxID=1888209 RepID=UPI001BD06390|nr:hypothetical protein [Nonlabens sp.]